MSGDQVHAARAVPERPGRRVRDVVVGAAIARPGEDGLDLPGDAEGQHGLVRARAAAGEQGGREN
jgi:hypothetical protein